jgi:hypothetical protein
LTLSLNTESAPMMATAIPAAMIAYSIAVAPP